MGLKMMSQASQWCLCSPLESLKKLAITLWIFEIRVLGRDRTAKVCIGIEERTYFKRVSLPPKERNLTFHPSILFLIFISKSWKYEVLLLPLKIGAQKYTIGRLLNWKPVQWWIKDLIFVFFEEQRKQLLYILTSCPEAFSYSCIKFI